ncbi:MAG: hypothetical protein AAGD25_22870 [Cyanobacteria bacterium P01_F01_bin.150]
MTNLKVNSVSSQEINNKIRAYSLSKIMKFIVAFGLAFSAFTPVADAHSPDCTAFEGTFEGKTAQRRYYEHFIRLSVDRSCRVTGSWSHSGGSSGGNSSINGWIDGDIIRFTRSARNFRQSYEGQWSPGFFNGQGFAAGTFDGTGVWYMERQRR